MKGLMKFIFLITTLFVLNFTVGFADNPHFVDFAKVLNSSKAGAEAQKQLKKIFETESKNFAKQEANLRKEETDLIAKKKLITNEEYKKNVDQLRAKVVTLQKNKKKSFDSLAKKRNDQKKALLIAVNPIIKKYMEENNIKVILEKKTLLMGDVNLDITQKIISILIYSTLMKLMAK